MLAQNNELTSYLAWKVYVATVPAWIPTYTVWVNEVAVKTYIEANCTFSRLWWVNGLQIVKDFGATVASIRGDECDYVETKYTRPQITINQDWLENIDVDAISIITWLSVLNVASSPVAVTTEIILASGSGSVAKWAVYVLDNKNWDNTIVSSIVVDVDWTPLVLNTDYTTKVDTDWSVTGYKGQTYITFLNTTTLNKQVDVDYSYTPNATKYTWVKSSTLQLPQLIVKIVWCPNASAKYNTHYLVNSSISGTITQGFVDIAQAGSPVASPISFVSNVWGYMIDEITRWV